MFDDPKFVSKLELLEKLDRIESALRAGAAPNELTASHEIPLVGRRR